MSWRQPPGEPPRRRSNRSVWMIPIALLLIWVVNLVFRVLRELLR
jgi:cytochrome c-type biogenesis protein CcmH/NrfF